MDGLEFQEVSLSDLEYSGRLDSEYYKHEYLEYEKKIRACNHKEMSKVANFLIGPFGSAYDTSNYTEVPGYRYVRGQDVKPFMLKDVEPRYMTKEDYTRLEKYALHAGDILVSVVGTLGNACVVQEKDVPAIFSCKSSVIRVTEINSYYLIGYLNCKYGRSLLLRQERGAIQKGLNLDDLKTLSIPIFSDGFQKIVEKQLEKAMLCIYESKNLYRKAEEYLEKELKFDTFIESEKAYGEKLISASFGTTGRLDSQYYQKKYEDYYRRIVNYRNGYKKLKDVCNIKDNNFNPLDSKDYSYIELSNIGASGNITEAEVIKGADLPSRARRIVATGDVVVSLVEGSMSKCALVTPEFDDNLCSNGFYVVNSDLINSETLLILFKSKGIQELMKKGCSGTILMAISKNEFENIPIPIISDEIQSKIKELINESSNLRGMNLSLIENAKKMIEYAIEQGEAEAIKYYEEVK